MTDFTPCGRLFFPEGVFESGGSPVKCGGGGACDHCMRIAELENYLAITRTKCGRANQTAIKLKAEVERLRKAGQALRDFAKWYRSRSSGQFEYNRIDTGDLINGWDAATRQPADEVEGGDGDG